MRLSLITAMTSLALFASSAIAQSLPDSATLNTSPGAAPVIQLPSEFLMEPDAQIEGLNIKQKTFRSKAVGQNKGWDLDIGRFQGEIDEDPNGVYDDMEDDTYSGMRLRLPFRGGTN